MKAATLPPLYLPDFPTIGPTGERDNLERLRVVQSALLPPGRLLVIDVEHDDDCPAPRRECTCSTVDVTLRVHDQRAS